LARKILLADDSVTAQNMGRRILTDAGYEVITVNNGSAALKKIAESKPDLIILDVYMPGYGGLEVCQRLKESPETGRIPVLLSVGKLEPFKVEESRRVRADGFIIKPFEASELLTALTKLEDKIVPQAESFKPGRFAKAIASAEQSSTTTQGIGGASGWQSRLTIPAATPKPEEAEKKDAQPASAGLRDTAQREESKSVAMKSAEAAAASALPQGITTEELAAIAAAATTFAGKSEDSAAETTETETPVAAKTDSPVEEKTEPAAEVAEAVTFASAPEVHREAQKEYQTPAQAAELQRATTDAEVLAALASLSPTHAEGSALAPQGDEVFASVATAGREQVAETRMNGPRWIAQAVAVAEDESTLILEREMEKAYAAMADLEAEKTSALATETQTSITDESAPQSSSSGPAFAPAEISSSIATEPAQPSKPEEPVPSPELPSPVAAPVAIIEPEVVTAARVPEVSATEVVATVETSSTTTESATTEDVSVVSATTVPAVNEPAAFAAAASAGGVSESVIQADSSPAAEVASVGESTAVVPVGADPGRESELAAAWQNWKQIRESIVGSSAAAPKAETAGPVVESSAPSEVSSPAFKEIRREEPAAAKPDAENASDGTGEASEISSIVDNMLAELKPKLMEEISKKMGKSKKKK
jgi:CheY-like chemotaxis protein